MIEIVPHQLDNGNYAPALRINNRLFIHKISYPDPRAASVVAQREAFYLEQEFTKLFEKEGFK